MGDLGWHRTVGRVLREPTLLRGPPEAGENGEGCRLQGEGARRKHSLVDSPARVPPASAGPGSEASSPPARPPIQFERQRRGAVAAAGGQPPCRHARYNLAPGLGRRECAHSRAAGCRRAGWKAQEASGLVIPAIGACRYVCGVLKAEVTVRASSFTETQKSSNCKTRHKGIGLMLAHSQRLDAHPRVRVPRGRISWDPEGKGRRFGITRASLFHYRNS